MNVTLTSDSLDSVKNHGTVWSIGGVNAETGEWVAFAGDWRPMRDLCSALADLGELTVEIEPWQVV